MGAQERRLDVAALDAAVTILESCDLERQVLHARMLRGVLELHRVHVEAGWELATSAELALVRKVSENVAAELLGQALLLDSLEHGLGSVESGLLTIEQAGALSRAMAGLTPDVHAAVWAVLRARLTAARASGEVLSPARLTSLLAGWILQADPVQAQERRRRAEQNAEVSCRRRPDGLVDLFALGIGAVNARALLSRIRERSQPWGSGDDRPAGKRRLEAFVDLLLGRDQLSVDSDDPVATGCCPCRRADRSRQAAPCGCVPGQPSPCGVQVTVLVPIGAALGTTDELATLSGHGPLDRGQLTDVLAAAPTLTAVWIDDDGTPVAEGGQQRPGRGDPARLRAALLRLRDAPPPGRSEPRHRLDHPPPPAPPRPGRTPAAHPPGAPGAYRPGAGLSRLLRARAPRCEWPACGAAAARCDLDHDLAWPLGPTCGCNLGPLCRRHHRLKHLVCQDIPLVRKQRLPGNQTRWTDPTGRVRLSPSQHEPPAAARRPLPALAVPAPADCTLSPDDGNMSDDDDPANDGPWTPAPDPLDQPAADDDELAARLLLDQRWGYELDNPYLWLGVDLNA